MRYYDNLGLLHSARGASDQRLFSLDAVDRVVLIQWAFAAGLCSSGLARVVAALDAGCSRDALEQLALERRRLEREAMAARERLRTFDELAAHLRSAGSH